MSGTVTSAFCDHLLLSAVELSEPLIVKLLHSADLKRLFEGSIDISLKNTKCLNAPAVLLNQSGKLLPSSENDKPKTPGIIRSPAPDLFASQIPYFSHSA